MASGQAHVLPQAGTSPCAAGLTGAAIGYWQRTVSASERLLGTDHPDTINTRAHLATSYTETRHRRDEAIEMYERVVGDRESLDTVYARAELADPYWLDSRFMDAAALLKGVVADVTCCSAPHSETITSRDDLYVSIVTFSLDGEEK